MHAVHVDLDAQRTSSVVDAWKQWGIALPLDVLPAPYREPGGPLRAKVESLHADGVDIVSVVIAEVVPRWWQRPLYESEARWVRAAVLAAPKTAVIEDPVPL
jgi:hypothetical protein